VLRGYGLTGGSYFIDGAPANLRKPQKARDRGIEVVYRIWRSATIFGGRERVPRP